MEKINNLINELFSEYGIELKPLITENYKVLYTYIGLIQDIDLKVMFNENSSQSASILLACEYGDEQELIDLSDIIEYMKEQIELVNKEEFAIIVQDALKEDGIEMSKNFTMDIVIGNGTHVKDILSF